ncbi:MAG TPA: CHASE domain-containing protein [Rhizobacter sp.]|nr:CHASE domain-containing protein [Rhizobacter sp.]
MTSAPFRKSPHWTLALAGTALAYAVVGWASLLLAVSPGYASPLYPSAGIALASVLTFGWRMLAGVALGSFIVNILVCLKPGTWNLTTSVALPAAIACGAMLQAAAGAVLVRRFVSQPLRLSELRDIAVFFVAGGVVACFTSCTIGTAALWLLNKQAADSLLFTWWIWGTGDTLGVLIAAPIVLTLIGQPRDEWAARRMTVGLTLCVAMLLMALGIRQVGQWEEKRVVSAFERDAVHASSNLASQMQYPLHALEALRDVFLASEDVSRAEMERATAAWVSSPGDQLQAMGWSEMVMRPNVPAFEAKVRVSDGVRDFTVYDRFDSGFKPSPDDKLTVIRYIEPLQENASALGVNARSITAARDAIDTAIRTDSPVASAGFRLTQDVGNDESSVVIYHALYNGSPSTAAERLTGAHGVVFVTLRMNAALQEFQTTLPRYLNLCVVDTAPGTGRHRLAGSVGCETKAADLLHVRSLAFAGRQWELRVSASREDVPDARERNSLLLSLVGLLATAMLGALLLTVTGRTRRIETAVAERTAALQREIAERERTDADLRESEQRFRNILNNVPIGVVYTDLHGNVQQVNPRFCELTGYNVDQLMSMNVTALTHPEDHFQDFELSGQLVRGEIPMYRHQGRYLTRDSRTVWIQSIVTLLRDTQGRPHRVVGVVEDITEHLRLAEAERAREIAEAANLAKSEFLSRMSHELRTPLNAVLGFAQLLELDQAHPLPQAQRPWVAQIQSAGWHLLNMINDVLDLSRIESGTLNLQPETLDLREILESTLALVERDAQRRGIIVSQEVGDTASRVTGDATRVKQILTNLLSNAVKYNSDGGRLHIATRAGPRDSVEIVVSDTGLGMTPEQLAQLFQPFNRLGRERSSLEGTGIGLVISRRLAELMGGTLRAISTTGEGSSFVLSLPRADVRQPVAELRSPEMSASDYHQRVVHYVEDNETNIEVMRGILSRRAQVRLDVSVTGLDGLVAIRARRPDLILLDMHLPDIDGMELLRHLKADVNTADIPVVVVSADALASQIETAMAEGAQNYLTKPVSVSQLLAVVDAVLDEVDTRYF